jgi:hypothetical protein
MIKNLLLTGIAATLLVLVPITASGQDLKAASEGDRTRLGRDEITKVMIQVSRVPRVDQDRRMDSIWTNQLHSKTPRSDFLFCVGLAYLGNYKAQACMARAYEKGIGIVQDSAEAYVWYSIALDNPNDEKAIKQELQAARQRVKQGLISMYPAPSDEDLADLVQAQKHRIAEYLAETRNARP